MAPHLKKGVGVFVSGDAYAEAWIDKETKEVRSCLRIYVTDLNFITSGRGRAGKEKEDLEEAVKDLAVG